MGPVGGYGVEGGLILFLFFCKIVEIWPYYLNVDAE